MIDLERIFPFLFRPGVEMPGSKQTYTRCLIGSLPSRGLKEQNIRIVGSAALKPNALNMAFNLDF